MPAKRSEKPCGASRLPHAAFQRDRDQFLRLYCELHRQLAVGTLQVILLTAIPRDEQVLILLLTCKKVGHGRDVDRIAVNARARNDKYSSASSGGYNR